MKKYIGFLVFVLILSLFAFTHSVKAESGSDDSKDESTFESEKEEKGGIKIEKERKKEELKREKEVFKQELKIEKETFKEKTKEERETLKDKTKEERDLMRDKLKTEREAFKEKIKMEREAFKGKLKTEKEAFLAELKTRKEEWKNTRGEKKLEFCAKAKEAFSGKFSEAISKLGSFQTRVAEVISKVKAGGQDTSSAEEALAMSKTKLSDAKIKIDGIKTLVPEGSCENMTPEVFEKIKLQAREAKDLLKESKNYLHDSIKELKVLRGEDETEDESADDNGVDPTETGSADDNGTDTN